MRLDDIWRGRSLRIVVGVAVMVVGLVTEGADWQSTSPDMAGNTITFVGD